MTDNTSTTRAARPDASPFSFQPALPSSELFTRGMPVVLDLTSAPDEIRDAVTDEVDDAATRALAPVAGAVALWRTWRMAPGSAIHQSRCRVYLLEIDAPASDLPGVTAGMRQALAGAGEPNPQIEVYRAGEEPSAYQRLARGGSALLWTALPGTPVETARVFDRVDPVTGPLFDDGHEVLASGERERLARYLEAGSPLLVTTERAVDIVDPARGRVVPMSYRTDGRWIWTDTVTYYLMAHGLSPDADLLEHVRAADYRMPDVDAVAGHRALAHLYRP
jgi:hypothetical protein